ncbi:ankyrin repeat domain-containing protein 11-like isoform X1 [Dreissena polymorpha]|nr:ankyrin repeat domain-containing protein 11-like isoform X1 [Dreissena polymorpha]
MPSLVIPRGLIQDMSDKKSPPRKEKPFLVRTPQSEEKTSLKRKLLSPLSPSHDEDDKKTPKRKRGSISCESSPLVTTQKTPGGGSRAVPLSERQQLAMIMRMSDETSLDTPTKPSSPTPIQAVKKTSLDKKVFKRNARGEMPIHLAAINGDIKLLKKLIKAGSDVNVADFAGWTPLHEASNRGWFSVTKHLLKAGANVNVQGFENDTPLHDAAINGHKKLVQLLLKHGANPLQQNAKGKTALDVASSPEMVRVLKKEIICSASDSSSIEDLRSPNSPDSVNSYKDDEKSLDGDDLNHHNDRHNSFSTGRRMSIGAPKSPGDGKLASPRLCLKFHRDHLGQTSHKSMDSTYSVTNISVSEVDLMFSPVDSPASSVDSDLLLGLTNSSHITTSNRVKITVPDDDSLDSNQSHEKSNYQLIPADNASSCDGTKQLQTRELWPEQNVNQNKQSHGDVTFSSDSFPYSLKADSKTSLQPMGTLPFQPSSQFDNISILSQDDEDSLLPDLEIETEKIEKSIPESKVDDSNSKLVNSFKDVLNSLSSTSATSDSASVSNISNISPVMESGVSSNSAVTDSQDIRHSAGDFLESEPLNIVSSSEPISCVSDSEKSVSVNEELTEKAVSSDNNKNQNSNNYVTEISLSEKTGNQSDIVRACSPISPEIDVTSSRPTTPKVPPLKIIIPPKSQSALSTPTCSETNDGLKLVVTNVKSALPYVINPYQNPATAEMVKNSDSKQNNHVQALISTFEFLSNNKNSSGIDERSHFSESVLRKEVLTCSSIVGNSGVPNVKSVGETTDKSKYDKMEEITRESYGLIDSASNGNRGINVECENGSVYLDSLNIKGVKSETDNICRDDLKKGDTSQRVLRSTVRSQLNSNVLDSKAVQNRAPKTSQERAQDKLEKTEKNNGVDSSISPSVSPEPEISSSRTGKDEEDTDLLPRKRKFRRQDGNQTSMDTDISPELEPLNTTMEKVPNPFELYLNLRKKIASRRCGYLDRVTICPKSPQGFKDYLLKTCNYVLQGNSASMLSVPTLSPPNSVKDKMRDLFVTQEECRYKLRLQHLIEREKVKLSIEQEILREHGRWARALVNQGTPLSVCTILREEEIYNFTEDQVRIEEKDKRNRTRFNGRQFLSWIQDVDDKYEKIKELLILRQKQEADSLWAYQKLEWEWRMKELALCERNATPEIDDLHVPLVVVSDNFELRPT